MRSVQITAIPEIFQQGAGISGRFLLGPYCELIYERTCTRGSSPVTHTVTLCENVCQQSCNDSICFRWKTVDTTVYEDRFDFDINTCDAELRRAYHRAFTAAAAECIEAQVKAMEEEYADACEPPSRSSAGAS